MYDGSIEEIERYIATNKDLKKFIIFIDIFHSNKNDSYKGFINKESFKFNTSKGIKKDLHFKIYRDKIEVSSSTVLVLGFARSFNRIEDLGKKLSNPQRIMEAFWYYFNALYA